MGLNREIERKWRVDASLDHRKLGRLLGEPELSVTQVDEIFARDRETVLDLQPGDVVARLRTADRRRTLTVKQTRQSGLNKAEAEVSIYSVRDARDCLILLGLDHVLTVRKHRRQWVVGDQVRLCLDDVAGLGMFVEIEWLMGESDGDSFESSSAWAVFRTQQPQIATTLNSQNEVTRGYDELLLDASAVLDSPLSTTNSRARSARSR